MGRWAGLVLVVLLAGCAAEDEPAATTTTAAETTTTAAPALTLEVTAEPGRIVATGTAEGTIGWEASHADELDPAVCPAEVVCFEAEVIEADGSYSFTVEGVPPGEVEVYVAPFDDQAGPVDDESVVETVTVP